MLQKDAGEAEPGLSGRVEHRNGNCSLQELSERIASIHRQTVVGHGGVHMLSLQERPAMRDRIVAAMTEA